MRTRGPTGNSAMVVRTASFHLMMALMMSLTLLSSGADGAPVTSKFEIESPFELKRMDGGYDHREALFGMPPYGHKIQARMYYATNSPTMCHPPPDDEMDHEEMKPPFILMVDRGDCTFVQKVRNAQRLGAIAVVIADNRCLCDAGDACTPSKEDEECERAEPMLADDGSGQDIKIPSFMLFKQEADPIKKALVEDNKVVRAKMSWMLPQSDDHVEYELWTTPTDGIGKSLMGSFLPYAEALGHHAYFTPHNYVYDGTAAGCVSSDGENMCSNLCTNNGRYCLSDPDDDLESGISGADVVTESLRRACIWQEYGKDGIGVRWWTYVGAFDSHCHGDRFFSEACIEEVMHIAGVDRYDIETCMKQSGGTQADGRNSLLEAELATREEQNVVILPALFVNKSPLRGRPYRDELFEAICSAFERGSEPPICTTCRYCTDMDECLKQNKCMAGMIAMPDDDRVSIPFFFASLVMISIILFAGFIFRQQRSEKVLKDQVTVAMASYQKNMTKSSKSKMTGSNLEMAEISDSERSPFISRHRGGNGSSRNAMYGSTGYDNDDNDDGGDTYVGTPPPNGSWSSSMGRFITTP